MEFRELKYFIAVAREGNISKAAESLFITQPSLSRQIQILESKLGVKLFKRSNRNTTLTEKGKLLYQYALEIIDLVDKTERHIKENESITGEVVIGSGICASTEILSDLMQKFSETNPLVTFDLVTGTRDQVMEKMDMGLIDIGLIVGYVGDEKYGSVSLGSNDRFVLLTKKDSPLGRLKNISPKDIGKNPISIPKTASSSRFFLDWYGEGREKLNIYTTHDLLDNVIPLVKRDICSVVTLADNARHFTQEELTIRELAPTISCESFLIWNKNKIHTATVSKFIDFINEYFKKMD